MHSGFHLSPLVQRRLRDKSVEQQLLAQAGEVDVISQGGRGNCPGNGVIRSWPLWKLSRSLARRKCDERRGFGRGVVIKEPACGGGG